ncbi:MAG: hypothetical protein IJ877_04465 [Candidatus Gastranaerophilales bacterium]|nr:hypothetical protein [Candidatus Gastranaerophilales bacterium]
MKINGITTKYINSSRGLKELEQFRIDAHTVLDDIDNMSSIVDYSRAKDAEGKAQVSIQARLKKLLFTDTPQVGAQYATKPDTELLSDLKKTYVELEKEDSFLQTFSMGSGHVIDRTEEVREIKF